jgi:hypothetical protein
MGVEKITFGEEEYRMSSLSSWRYKELTGRTRLRPTIIKSSSNSLDALILHTKCCNLVRPYALSSPSNYLSLLSVSMRESRLIISHIPTHQFLSRNVKLSAFQSGTIEANYRLWRNGGTPSLRIYGMSPFPVLSFGVLMRRRIIRNEVFYRFTCSRGNLSVGDYCWWR